MSCWIRLWREGGRQGRPDAVVVGYLGHFDVHLARRRFRRSTIVLDHMVSLGDTGRDRGLEARGLTTRLLDRIDRAALRAADIVLVDTVAQGENLPVAPARLCVVPVAPPAEWFDTIPAPMMRETATDASSMSGKAASCTEIASGDGMSRTAHGR